MLPFAAAALSLFLSAPMPKPARVEAAREAARRTEQPPDASAYPPELREAHALFHQKCAKCHPLSVASSNALTTTQMKRHLKRPGLATSPEELERIVEFLKVDASRRASR